MMSFFPKRPAPFGALEIIDLSRRLPQHRSRRDASRCEAMQSDFAARMIEPCRALN
jgi:hypothetical protein